MVLSTTKFMAVAIVATATLIAAQTMAQAQMPGSTALNAPSAGSKQIIHKTRRKGRRIEGGKDIRISGGALGFPRGRDLSSGDRSDFLSFPFERGVPGHGLPLFLCC